ncbi:hypothetical protein AYL99_09210 [Fonsecaea erecta]|uniref:NmrA-like domain-containing protein n=1 Tax=Fonsecaea erecta TaxID=1367422 RepID=A0A178ZBE0_9EURO|nr:hypothetical protein AYL99_09210 [Fonsecaea erecta]OAP57097.1 hypothetical protein AYL99_09210 [Fonsecaea erecta]
MVVHVALAQGSNCQVSVLTRDTSSSSSHALQSAFPTVKLLQGSYTTGAGLRTALADQDVVYFNIDSFSVGEPFEYFWTFRAYEIAVQSNVKWLIYAGTGPVDKFVAHGFAEEYRNSHNLVAGRLTGWLTAQPLDRLAWSIIIGGVYAEMLNRLLKPVPRGDGYVFQLPLHKESVMPLVPLDNYGETVKWALEHPRESVGRLVSASPFQVTFDQVAEALEQYTGKKTEFQPVTLAAWMEHVSASIDPEARLPRNAASDDTTAFTFRTSFGARWSIWRDNRVRETKGDGSPQQQQQQQQWAEVPPGLSKYETLQEWMVGVEYNPAHFSTSFKGKSNYEEGV